MSVHRVMGIETEFGISTPGHSTMNAMAASNVIVNAYAAAHMPLGRRMNSWDFLRESPLRDARGFDLSRSEADPSQLTDQDIGLANVVLTNGARLYVDHAHPEYSAPETTTPRDATLWDRAGVAVMAEAVEQVQSAPDGVPMVLYKNNTDNKGASYGCHENYLMARQTPFAEIVRLLTPFLISRQIFTGAGRLGKGQHGQMLEFQLTQRADFFEVEVGLETTMKRPIINTRDEPHADPEKFRRLHVITGDSNMSDSATLLKLGTTSLMLAMIEAGVLNDRHWYPQRPVTAMHQVSYDLDFTWQIPLAFGRSMSALQMQSDMLEAARAFCGNAPDPETAEILTLWEAALICIQDGPAACAATMDWAAKYGLMQSYRHRDQLNWDAPQLQAIDLQYADIRANKGLAFHLERTGRLKRLFSDAQVEDARVHPPTSTRAFFRGECVARYPTEVAAASWDSVVFDIHGQEALSRVHTPDPLRGTQAHVGHILDAAPDAEALLRALGSQGR